MACLRALGLLPRLRQPGQPLVREGVGVRVLFVVGSFVHRCNGSCLIVHFFPVSVQSRFG